MMTQTCNILKNLRNHRAKAENNHLLIHQEDSEYGRHYQTHIKTVIGLFHSQEQMPRFHKRDVVLPKTPPRLSLPRNDQACAPGQFSIEMGKLKIYAMHRHILQEYSTETCVQKTRNKSRLVSRMHKICTARIVLLE